MSKVDTAGPGTRVVLIATPPQVLYRQKVIPNCDYKSSAYNTLGKCNLDTSPNWSQL